MNVSVAMATYNGEKYIRQQIESIIKQLGESDELIISDDGSTDGTLLIIEESMRQDPRINFYENENHGVIGNFENAISKCQNDLIFLCDQDDIWKDDKVQVVKEKFEKNEKLLLLLSDLSLVDNDMNIIEPSIFTLKGSKKGIFKNIMKNSYMGCAMTFKKELLPKVLPFPKDIPMHDMWIGIIAEMEGQVEFLPTPLIYYRRHDNNVTQVENTTTLSKKLKWRFILVKELIKRRANH